MQSVEASPSYKSQIAIENETRAIIAGEVMNGIVGKDPVEDDIRELYDERYPANLLETEYSAAHILVKTEDEAKTLITELDGGAEFATLAREHSTGPSGTAGGELGWFGPGDMVEDFFNAILELEPGNVSPPVKTTFGWHIIKLNETRERERPDFDTVEAQLVEELRQSSLETFLAGLREGADITRAETTDIDPEVILNFGLLEK
jgi:peptidyl-prolyl cis-trans isomerase C